MDDDPDPCPIPAPSVPSVFSVVKIRSEKVSWNPNFHSTQLPLHRGNLRHLRLIRSHALSGETTIFPPQDVWQQTVGKIEPDFKNARHSPLQASLPHSRHPP